MDIIESREAFIHLTFPLTHMLPFIDHFDDERIVWLLCKMRAKIAHQRKSRHLIHCLSTDPKFNYHPDVREESASETSQLSQLNSLLPSRRMWKSLSRKSRYKGKDTTDSITSYDRNLKSLSLTVAHYRKNERDQPFVKNLEKFCDEVRSCVNDPKYQLGRPTIYPQRPKDTSPKQSKAKGTVRDSKPVNCRPISLYDLKDRVILGITNRFFTTLFDEYFQPCSFAFRAKRSTERGSIQPTHHDSIRESIEFARAHRDSELWVAESDIQKFYDSVNHSVIRNAYEKKIEEVLKRHPNFDLDAATRIFESYLRSYSFNRDVLPLNANKDFWTEHRLVKGTFGWVGKELVNAGNYYDFSFDELSLTRVQLFLSSIVNFLNQAPNIHSEQIGIPQGGALSGLIANLVIDQVDRIMGEFDVHYVRYCDDMLLIATAESECEMAISRYERALSKLKFVVHPRKELRGRGVKKQFWKRKSKGPFRWSQAKDDFNWIGFVGYEFNTNGEVRVRKSTLQKEIAKQERVIRIIRRAVPERRAACGTILESAIGRLIAMSVGGVKDHNYKTVHSEMCWKFGFRELNQNPYLLKQLKELDRSRSRLYYGLKKYLNVKKVGDGNLVLKTESAKRKKRRRASIPAFNRRYDKPFSYVFQIYDRIDAKHKSTDGGESPS